MAYLANVQTFVRVYELGSMSAAARDRRVSPAVASARIRALEEHLGVRLFQRTTRSLAPTEQGRLFYEGAKRILDSIDEAEATVTDLTQNPRGSLFVSAPLWLGRSFLAPLLPEFQKTYPEIEIRLRLSDRKIDITNEALDMAFILGQPEDSSLKMRGIAECARVLAAAPSYLERHGHPTSAESLIEDAHQCLLLRFPGAPEFQWTLRTKTGHQRLAVSGPFASDDGNVLTDWAVAGHGIVLKPIFEIAAQLASGALVTVAPDADPLPLQLACLFTHKRHQDPKARLFIEFVAPRLAQSVRKAEAGAGRF